MSETDAPTVMLCMPKGEARTAVRSALIAMHVEPLDILPSRTDLAKLARTLQADAHTVAIIDLAGVRHAATNILALAALLPTAAVRQRIVLTRSHCGLWPTDRAWVQELGFADLYAELDSSSLLAESNGLLTWVASLTGAAPIQSDALKQHFSTAQIKPDSASQRGKIRTATGLTAEALCTAVASGVKTRDRVYNLKTYATCFVGKEAVNWLVGEYGLTREYAVRVGAALQELGMLHHVTHEHMFGDEEFFYRTELTATTQGMSPGATLALLTSKSGVIVRDRTYHGTNYPACFVGSQAVDWLHAKQKLSRTDAEIMLNRLYGFDLVEHVTREHPVQDGQFFYRFVA
jgi:Domain found in Dishevelled, Egl-10, and Pleckstrin (DEP)